MKNIGLLVNTHSNDRDKLIFNEVYYSFAKRFGYVHLIHPRNTSVEELKSMDLTILIGGADIYPLKYGQPPMNNYPPCDEFEYFDFKFLPVMLKEKMPVFGICRGFQAINVALGGDMIQEIGHTGHKTSSWRGEPAHNVYPTSAENPYGVFETNSLHHQALGTIGKGLTVEYISADKKSKKSEPTFVAESFVGDNIFAVQWHPEELVNYGTCDVAQNYVDNGINKLLNI